MHGGIHGWKENLNQNPKQINKEEQKTMTVTVLIISACLMNTPNECKEFEVPMPDEMNNPAACVVQSVPVVAKWVQENPKWQFKRWKCKPIKQNSDGSLEREQGI
jgi:hypothetical protein